MLKAETKTILSVIILALVTLALLLIWQMPRKLIAPEKGKTLQAAIDKARSGDTVFVKAGVYNESIRFKNGVKLIGEGMDEVTIWYDTQLGHVIESRDCQSGIISGLTIEHRGQNKEGTERASILVSNSCIEITHCRIRNSLYDGIYVTGGNANISKCTLESNAKSGIVIDGNDTTATVTYNTCKLNEKQGIFFLNGARGQVENNMCENNKENGIAIKGKRTDITIKGNHCRANDKFGICFWNGAIGNVKDNLCERNKQSGIFACEEETKVTLNNNKCFANGIYGICLCRGAGGEVEGNICRNNKKIGIYINDEGTDVERELLRITFAQQINKQVFIYAKREQI
jgi:parallel beta-helix repeat protein